MLLPLYSENMVLSPNLWNAWDKQTQMAYIFYANLKGPDAIRYSVAIRMGIRNASRDKGFDYTNRSKIDLFI